jgi:DNA polymerase III alpha subunit (gram-positive type)
MIHALVQGTIFREVTQRTAKTGRQFVTATVRVKEGEGSIFVKVFAFADHTKDELLRLQDGDAVAAQGAFKAEIYVAADGTNKISLSVIADNILALRQPPKKREPKAKPSPSAQEQERAFDDVIPF